MEFMLGEVGVVSRIRFFFLEGEVLQLSGCFCGRKSLIVSEVTAVVLVCSAQ